MSWGFDGRLPMTKIIKARSDEPRYGEKLCIDCGCALSFETLAKRCPKCKKEHEGKRSQADRHKGKRKGY
jgi:hypothetical protein